MLDEWVCGTIEELAKRERVNRGYMSQVLRLTLVAPGVVEAILDRWQSAELQLDDLLEELPLFESQSRLLAFLLSCWPTGRPGGRRLAA